MIMSTKNKYIEALMHTGAILIRSIEEEPFTLRSGKKSYVFINHSILASSSTGYKSFIDAIKELILSVYKEKEFVLCNVDSKISAQMAGSLAYILNKPQIIFKSKELTQIEKGPGQQLTGDAKWKLPVVIVDDVLTGGDGTAAKVGKLVREYFPDISGIQIFTGFVRSREKNASATFPTHSVLSFDEVIDYAWDSLTPNQQKAIEKEKTL
jgi:orotate phosphoribosyltransferase